MAAHGDGAPTVVAAMSSQLGVLAAGNDGHEGNDDDAAPMSVSRRMCVAPRGPPKSMLSATGNDTPISTASTARMTGAGRGSAGEDGAGESDGLGSRGREACDGHGRSGSEDSDGSNGNNGVGGALGDVDVLRSGACHMDGAGEGRGKAANESGNVSGGVAQWAPHTHTPGGGMHGALQPALTCKRELRVAQRNEQRSQSAAAERRASQSSDALRTPCATPPTEHTMGRGPPRSSHSEGIGAE